MLRLSGEEFVSLELVHEPKTGSVDRGGFSHLVSQVDSLHGTIARLAALDIAVDPPSSPSGSEEPLKSLAHRDMGEVDVDQAPFVIVRSVFRAAVADGVIAADPTVGDLDFSLRQLTVPRQLQRDGDTFAVRLPKYGSERVVHLPDDLAAMLRGHIEASLVG